MRETMYYPLQPEENKEPIEAPIVSAAESAKAFVNSERKDFVTSAVAQHPVSKESVMNLFKIKEVIQEKYGFGEDFELDMSRQDHQKMVQAAILEIEAEPISKSTEKHQKETGADNRDVISVTEKYLKELVGSAYEMSQLLVADGSRGEDFSREDKVVLAKASKNLAKLVKLTNFDNQASVAVKSFFVKLLFQNINLHKNWNKNLRSSEKLDDGEYYFEERRLKDSVTEQLINQFIGAVDMELAALLALQKNPLTKKGSVDLASPEMDVLGGADLVFKLDPEKLKIEFSNKLSESEDQEILMRYLSKEEFGVQVKSHFTQEEIPGGMMVKLRCEKRQNVPMHLAQKEKCIIWLDVFYNSSVIKRGNVSVGSDQVRISQLDFDLARDATLESFDQLLEVIKGEYEKIHIGR